MGLQYFPHKEISHFPNKNYGPKATVHLFRREMVKNTQNTFFSMRTSTMGVGFALAKDYYHPIKKNICGSEWK